MGGGRGVIGLSYWVGWDLGGVGVEGCGHSSPGVRDRLWGEGGALWIGAG